MPSGASVGILGSIDEVLLAVAECPAERYQRIRLEIKLKIKPGRVAGYPEAKRIHDLCLAEGVDAWRGGMLETGIGWVANAALAALPGFTLPGEISASGRFYARDITAPFEIVDGCVEVVNADRKLTCGFQ